MMCWFGAVLIDSRRMSLRGGSLLIQVRDFGLEIGRRGADWA